MKILIADDEREFADWLSSEIRDTDPSYEVVVVYDGESAWQAIALSEIDVAICNIHMPRLLGTQILSLTKTHFPQISVILMTGSFAFPSQPLIARGALDLLVKPFPISDLQAILKRTR